MGMGLVGDLRNGDLGDGDPQGNHPSAVTCGVDYCGRRPVNLGLRGPLRNARKRGRGGPPEKFRLEGGAGRENFKFSENFWAGAEENTWFPIIFKIFNIVF